jgi:hypothetical protein
MSYDDGTDIGGKSSERPYSMVAFCIHDDSAKSISQKALIYFIQGQQQRLDIAKTI